MKLKYIVFSLLIISFVSLNAQTRWKRYRWEAVAGIGMANVLSDLGGANQVGTNYFRDLEFIATRPAINLGMRYKITETSAVRASLTWGAVKGDDDWTQEKFRNARKLHFSSHIVELSANYEFYFIKETDGHRFKLRGVKGIRASAFHPYGFFGIAGFWFNPRAQYLDGQWVNLRDLGTEGQLVSPTRRPYSRVQFAIPVGFGLKYSLNRRTMIGLEFGIRKTWTDYIDDVSTTYYPGNEIERESGPIAKYMADPSGNVGNSYAFWERGDPTDKDSYMFLMFNMNYLLKSTMGGLPKFR
jgi:hypothetical protein